jgi:sugar lactone lactonase YvrE
MKKIIGLSLFLIIFFSMPVFAAAHLTKIADSDKQWTGVAVSKGNRIFVNYPTWNDYPEKYKVAELIDGKPVAYPNEAINQDFVCVQSVVVDDQNHLWILDSAKLKNHDVAPTGARLYEVDLSTNELRHIYVFSGNAALPESYLNDVRIDMHRQMAYLTDSSIGGIVVLDLHTGESWRALSDIPEVKANLQVINFKSTGPNTHMSQSDGIELSEDKSQLYFTALGGNILYQVPTKILRDRSLSVAKRENAIKVLNAKNVPTDGMLLKDGKLYMANLPEETIWEYDLKKGTGHNLFLGEDIRWADSFAKGPDNSIYFTTSEINYAKEQRVPYSLYRLTVDDSIANGNSDYDKRLKNKYN